MQTSDRHERAMARADKVRKMHADGLPIRAIARKLRMKVDHVRKIAAGKRLVRK